VLNLGIIRVHRAQKMGERECCIGRGRSESNQVSLELTSPRIILENPKPMTLNTKVSLELTSPRVIPSWSTPTRLKRLSKTVFSIMCRRQSR
jgi:hypothetical protein